MLNPTELESRRAELRRDIAGRQHATGLMARTSAAHDDAERLLKAMRFNASLLEMMRISTIHRAAGDGRLRHRDLVRMRRVCVYI